MNDSKLEDITIGTVKNLPYATVHATAVYKNCPHAQLTQDDIDSLGRFITCTDHLKKNVAIVHHDLVFSDGIDMNDKFQHSVQVRIVVRTRICGREQDLTFRNILEMMSGREVMVLPSH